MTDDAKLIRAFKRANPGAKVLYSQGDPIMDEPTVRMLFDWAFATGRVIALDEDCGWVRLLEPMKGRPREGLRPIVRRQGATS